MLRQEDTSKLKAASRELCAAVLASESPGNTTSGWNQAHIVARSMVPNAQMKSYLLT